MSHNIQAYHCGPDVIKIVTQASPNNITTMLPNSISERERENKRTSLSRTRRIVADILHCNYFRFFLTVTLGDENGSPPTRDDVVRACKVGLRTIKRRANGPIGYIIVPEMSANDEFAPGRWHGHIMLTDMPVDVLQPYSPSDTGLPSIIYRRMAAGIDCFAAPAFGRRGYCLVERVGNTQKDYDSLAAYLTKTMYLDTCAPLPKGQRRIISSHGLERPERIFSGMIGDSEYKAICAAAGETLHNRDTLIHYVPRSAISFI